MIAAISWAGLRAYGTRVMEVRGTVTVWWHASKSDIFVEEWNQEESDHPEFSDIPEGSLDVLKGHIPR